ncbi:MAG: hypothetical protein HOG49_19975 [Candidatus Scalindua sp.]|nr:hypothetical protein [Candidatus Scalindua sp.]
MTISAAINTSITKEEYLLKIKDLHTHRRYIELVAQGGEECPDDLTEEGLMDMMQENFDKIKPLILEVTECDEMSSNDRIYWGNHLNAFAGYLLTRASNYEEAERFYLSAAQGFEMYEEVVPYPHSIPWNDIEEYTGGVYAHATKVYGYYASTLAFQEKEAEANEAYLENITRARINYKLVPESIEALSEALFRAGEHFRFDRDKDALNYLKEAVELLENVTSLKESIAAGDVKLLRYKDTLAEHLGMCGKKREKKKMDKELKPYADYITWRFEFNVFDLDKDEEGADNELTPL